MKQWIALSQIAFFVALGCLVIRHANKPVPVETPYYYYPEPYYEPPPPEPAKPEVSVTFPGYLSYQATVAQLKQWETEGPDYVEVGTYGTSSRGQDLVYIRLTNKLNMEPKPKVLLTAAIHGNEPVSSGVLLGLIGDLLANHLDILNERDIYFIPIINPDSYPHSRHVDGVDPNRDFNGRSVKSIQALKDFFDAQHFNATASGHTGTSMIMIPPGERNGKTNNDADYQRIGRKMAQMTGYDFLYLHEIYGRPILGGEADWYDKRKAFSVVIEFGPVQGVPNKNQVEREYNKTRDALLYFIQEAPVVEMKF